MDGKTLSFIRSDAFKAAKIESIKAMKAAGYDSSDMFIFQEGFNECAAIVEQFLRGEK